MIRSIGVSLMWHSDVKGNREKNGWHPRNEETYAGLVLWRLSIWFSWEKVSS